MDQVSTIAFQEHAMHVCAGLSLTAGQQPTCCAVPAVWNGMQHVIVPLIASAGHHRHVCTPGAPTSVQVAQCVAGCLLTLGLLLCRPLHVQAWRLLCWDLCSSAIGFQRRPLQQCECSDGVV